MAIQSRFWSVLLTTATIVSFHIGAEATTTSTSTETSSISSLGSGCYDPWIGDGFCDPDNNNAECAYDNGDCCDCTCIDNDYTCGVAGFACVDPEAPCVDDDDFTSVYPPSFTTFSGCIDSYISDGYCDYTNNQPDCQYDGGDCCSCTCDDSADYSCGVAGFACVDPEASCVDDDDVTSVNPSSSFTYSGCIDYYIGDGYCDYMNNNPDCQYDGGDCCSCTCDDTVDYSCGVTGFACVDPEAPCVDDDGITSVIFSFSYTYTTSTSSGCIDYYIGDGYCDYMNNNPDCQYDGGDCCSCTCDDTADYTCGVVGFACADPEAPCVSSGCIESFLGDGYCDPPNNQPGCLYDGGDCCSCTCVDTADYSCSVAGFACIDPEAPCVDDDDVTAASYSFSYDSSISTCAESSIGNGYCDSINNQPDCKYDGGDCCSCTCVDALYFCGSNGYSCEDPEAYCVDGDDDTADYENGSQESSAKQHSPTFVGTVCIGAIGVLTFALE